MLKLPSTQPLQGRHCCAVEAGTTIAQQTWTVREGSCAGEGQDPKPPLGLGTSGLQVPRVHEGEDSSCPGDWKRWTWGLNENACGSILYHLREKQILMEKLGPEPQLSVYWEE